MTEENILTYETVAPLISQYITFAEIPAEQTQVEETVPPEITKAKILAVLDSDNSATEIAVTVGLTKEQVIKIQKEFAAAKAFKGGEQQ